MPFFVHGEPAFATGIGERLTPFSVPPTWFVVLTPPTHVSTAAVFAAPELTRHTASAKILLFFEGHGRNDLQDVAAARFPEVIQCLEALEAAGETGARMTGSGGCVFSAFPSEGSAELALSRIRHERGIDGFVTRTVPRHPLWQFA